MSIETLLKAAEYVEWKDRAEAEHGYASSPPVQEDHHIRKHHFYSSSSSHRSSNKSRKSISQGNRSTHNELEKNRRAHLRYCLERLKEIVPLGPDCSRHTTLGLLTKARAFIKALEEKERRQLTEREMLHRDRLNLQQKMTELTNGYRVRVGRSVSECSSSLSSSSTSSGSPASLAESYESDEVDILGYGSSEEDQGSNSGSSSVDGATTCARNLAITDHDDDL